MSENLDKVCVSELAYKLESLYGFAREKNSLMENFLLGKIFGYANALYTTGKITLGQQLRIQSCGQQVREMGYEKMKFDEMKRKIPELLRDALKNTTGGFAPGY